MTAQRFWPSSGDSVEGTLPSFCWSYKIQDKEATVTVLTVLAVMAILVVTATPPPLNSTPLFRHPDPWIISIIGPLGKKRKGHININFLLWLGSGWPWDNRPVNRTKNAWVLFRTQENKHFLLVDRLVVPGLTAFSKSLCVKSLCTIFLPG